MDEKINERSSVLHFPSKQNNRLRFHCSVTICSSVLFNMVAASYMCLLQFKLTKIKQNLKFSSSVAQTTFQVHNSHMWLMATIIGSVNIDYFHHHRRFYWIALIFLSLNLESKIMRNTMHTGRNIEFRSEKQKEKINFWWERVVNIASTGS